MRKHITFCFMMILTVLLALPIYSIAETKLILDSGGSRIGGAAIESFSMGSDDTIVFYLKSGFANKNIVPDISIANVPGDGSCTITLPATVSAMQGSTFQFQVSTDTGATLTMAVSPDTAAQFLNGIFSWNTGGTPPVAAMPYLVTFQSCLGTCFGTGPNDFTSQLLVWININPPETVSVPTVTGPTTGTVGVAATFTASGSTSSLGHSVQYQIDCGNGTNSSWLPVGTTSYGCTYGSTGSFGVTAKAKCSQHAGIESALSSPASITISTAPVETITTPAVTGPTTGSTNQTYTFTAQGSTSSLGHSVQYQIDCGNGANSGWLAVGTASYGCTYGSTGSFGVTAKARCSQDYVESATSSPASITISQAGSWSSIVASSPHLVSYIMQGYGIQGQGITSGGTNYYVYDPKGDNLFWYACTLIQVQVRDYTQSQTTKMTVIKLNANNDEISRTLLGEAGGDWDGYVSNLTQAEFNAGYKLLTEIKSVGGVGCSSCISLIFVLR